MTQENNSSSDNKIQATPKDSTEQLTLLGKYQEFVKNANTQIDRVSKIHWTLLIILGLVIAVGIFFTYRTASDFKTEVRNDVEILKKEVEKRIDDELSKEQLHKLITEKVSERITKVADDLIKQHIAANISPKIIELDNKLSEVSLELNKIKEDRKKLDELNDFTLTFLKALGDDYKAFEQLGNWSADQTFDFHEISFNLYDTIRCIHFQQKSIPIIITTTPPITVDSKAIDFSKLPFSEFKTLFSSLPPRFHADLIKKIWERKEEEISKIEKMSFLIEVLNTSNSLNAKNMAGIFFEKEYNDVFWDPFKFDPINTKWKNVQKTNNK